jgi:glycosyltransferase involved in cell wall biosynthesis
MTTAAQPDRPLVLITGPPSVRGFGINTHVRMLMGTRLSDAYRLEQVELGGETWRASAPARMKRTIGQLAHLRREVRGRRPALVHLNSAPDAKAFLRDAAALWLIAGPGTRTIFEFHGGFEQNTALQGPRLVRDFAKRTLKKASAVIVLNRYHADLLLSLCPGLDNVRVIPNFLEAGMMSGLISGPLAAAGGRLRLLFVGRVAREKGVLESIEAAAILRGRGRDVGLTIVGAGEDLKEAKTLSAARGLDGVVEFAGFLDGDDKVRAYRSSDVLLFPTYWNEGFPYVLLEAMAAGLPIVSTTHGVMPHLLKDGVNGCLAEPRNAAALAEKIEKLASDPGLRLEIGRNNRREVQESYSAEEAARAYGRLYGELLG